MNTILAFFHGLVPRCLRKSDVTNSDVSRNHYYIPVMQSSKSPMSATKEHKIISIPISCASPPSYNDVSGAVIINQDGKPHFLSPEEEVERRHRLQQAVREKMLGLPRMTKFEWYHRTSGTTGPVSEELPPPLYTPREDEKK
ncbi:hypothetical protein DTO013E5_9333 [Penicillium roqueforti]|uniref:uncharacterized protein n=1 Tax=Penicillium roqueforti TaxID=5082 RepID=UPI00190BA20A|nr:uncharacterized protein LCP9604111_9092 [Penicillium roqueforti]KAF9239550.1 hypothetical protein LCP9604111_9092 [Penicillium roqueforti]KAI1829662.1 hypothetical protein CBS147337_9550 [Penicillium roqueforti]KAI2669969.1 hypothetical protein CBS147355_9557 [Penicillium roqueforti]KAI2671909.1 hypothetical protein LCP963914a_9540 [Penicillium roqueforti]KAI2695261.1 hypothetical protein CBS147372_9265 [Penicillium roqueforti]